MSASKIRLEKIRVEYSAPKPKPWLGWGGNGSNGAHPKVILDNLDIEIDSGDFVSILGHSGCGKSTLLKIIAGFSKASSGTVWIDGSKVDGPRADHVFVFQEGALFPWLTITENVALALRAIKDPRERIKKAHSYLELVALDGVENHYPHMLSGGMKQRAEIARALAAEPDILLMDEPFSGLDYLTRLNLREEMLYLHVMLPKTTILFVTHDIDEALQLSNKLIILGEPPSQVKCCRQIDEPHPRTLNSESMSKMRAYIYHHLGVHSAL